MLCCFEATGFFADQGAYSQNFVSSFFCLNFAKVKITKIWYSQNNLKQNFPKFDLSKT